MAVHHLYRLHYHRLHLLLLVRCSILNSRLGSSANAFLCRPFPILPDWIHGFSDHLMILLCSASGFVYSCVRISQLLVGFWTHFKSMHFHFISEHKKRSLQIMLSHHEPKYANTVRWDHHMLCGRINCCIGSFSAFVVIYLLVTCCAVI